MHRRFLALAVPLSVLALGATGCSALGGSSDSGGAQGKNTITLYNGQHEQTTQQLVAAFEKENPSIKVNVRSDDEDVLAQQIAQEGAKSPADVIYTENSPALESLAGKGLLAPASKAALSAIPAKYDAPAAGSGGARDWAGVSARVSAMVVNTAQVPAGQAPTSILQLADPKWKGKLALAGGETDFQPVVTSIAKAYGPQKAEQWLKAVKANAASHLLPDNETVTADVDKGQAAIGLIDQYYWYRQAVLDGGTAKTHSKLAYFAPGDPGYVEDVSGAGVVKASTHQAAAEKFVEFLTSATAQKIIATSDSFEYPVRPGSAANPELPALSSLKPSSISVADLGDGSTAVSLLQQAQLL